MRRNRLLGEFARYTSLNVMGMLALSCYILADTFFISQGLGTNGLAALNLAIPVYSFIHGSGLMIGMGGATRYAISQGRGESARANRTFTSALYLCAGFAVFFVLVGLFLSGTLASLFGAQGAVYTMSQTYLQMILLFAPAFLLNNLLLCFVRNDGAPQLAMAAMVTGSLSNVVLDWVFIFPCQMGIFGAVLATGLAPIWSILVLSPHLVRRRNHFHIVRCRPRARRFAAILSSGLPSLVTEVSSGVVMIAFNAIILALAGNVGVAAYGVIANLSLVVLAIYTGIAQGVQPLVSRYHGQGQAGRTVAVLRYALVTMLALSVLLYAAVFLFAPQIAAIFNSEHNAALQSIAVQGLRLYFIACPFAGFNIILSLYLTSIEHPRPAHLISLLRGFLVILPAAFLLSWLWQLPGVWCAFPVTELAVAAVGLCYFAAVRRRALG